MAEGFYHSCLQQALAISMSKCFSVCCLSLASVQSPGMAGFEFFLNFYHTPVVLSCGVLGKGERDFLMSTNHHSCESGP